MSMALTPYLASARWYAEWLRGVSSGMSDMESRGIADESCGLKGKDFARCRIDGNGGELLLTIPVEGGATKLKRLANIPDLRMSEHGNWRRNHMGALNAVYGRAPYFQHMMPLLTDVYVCGETSLKRFNGMIHDALVGMLVGKDGLGDILAEVKVSQNAKARGMELASEISPAISIIDPLMCYGRETVIYLAHLINS